MAYYNIRADDERPTLLNCVASGEPLIVHDLAGGSLADLARISDMGEGLDDLLAAFAGQGYRPVILHLISAEVAATQSVARWLELAGDRVDHVAIRNTRWGKAEADSRSGTATSTDAARATAARSAAACWRSSAVWRSAYRPFRAAPSPRSTPTPCRLELPPTRRA